ncbi:MULTISPECIES: hypothetical protein [Comamonas]|uniref:hypothetical protein n=1 Tax=Comamonas TaxID=283 RepID=UPI00237DFBD2|nr:hypothetical protein [Comamonas aquatica]MDE1555901.1 hypothetical protein [Comamonas aquatica]
MTNYTTSFSENPTQLWKAMGIAIAMTMPFGSSAGDFFEDVSHKIESPKVRSLSISSSGLPFEANLIPSSGVKEFLVDEFEGEISNFYANLSQAQKPLEEEFSRILFANISDLYAD